MGNFLLIIKIRFARQNVHISGSPDAKLIHANDIISFLRTLLAAGCRDHSSWNRRKEHLAPEHENKSFFLPFRLTQNSDMTFGSQTWASCKKDLYSLVPMDISSAKRIVDPYFRGNKSKLLWMMFGAAGDAAKMRGLESEYEKVNR
jgi:hypothetical protein